MSETRQEQTNDLGKTEKNQPQAPELSRDTTLHRLVQRIDLSPSAWQQHWAAMSNNVRALYATFERTRFPWNSKEIRIEAWGQLCFDAAAANAVAYHMHNHGMRSGWRFVSWRCEMDAPPIAGGKLSGLAPDGFDIYAYVPRRAEER